MIQSLVSKKAQSDTWSIFFRLGVVLQIKIKSTKCRTWPFFSTSSRIRRVVMFDERVFDKSCTALLQSLSFVNFVPFIDKLKQPLKLKALTHEHTHQVIKGSYQTKLKKSTML